MMSLIFFPLPSEGLSDITQVTTCQNTIVEVIERKPKYTYVAGANLKKVQYLLYILFFLIIY